MLPVSKFTLPDGPSACWLACGSTPPGPLPGPEFPGEVPVLHHEIGFAREQETQWIDVGGTNGGPEAVHHGNFGVQKTLVILVDLYASVEKRAVERTRGVVHEHILDARLQQQDQHRNDEEPAADAKQAAHDIADAYLQPSFREGRRLILELHLAGARHPELATHLAEWHREFAAMVGGKMWHMWHGSGAAGRSTYGTIFQFTVLALGLAGLVLLAVRRRWEFFLLAALLAGITVVGGLLLAGTRRNVTLMPLVMALAGITVFMLAQRVWPRLAGR